jgi:hypothetical protein
MALERLVAGRSLKGQVADYFTSDPSGIIGSWCKAGRR